MSLTARDLNRTLLDRQHLLRRTSSEGALPMVEHLVGLQAQDNLPPYLSLAARLSSFDPYVVTAGLEDRSLVRMVVMRGTIHLLSAADALMLRGWTQPVQDRERRASQTIRPALHLDVEDFSAVLTSVLDGGALPMKELGLRLAEHYADVPPGALAQLARVTQPLAQLPPRGAWKQPGGVVLQHVADWVGRPLGEPDPTTIIGRYLRAFGPATAADACAWSGLTGLAPLLKQMLTAGEVVQLAGPDGKPLYDVPDGAVTPGEAPAPVRLLGVYDNVWLSHAARDRVTRPETRKRWMGTNGGLCNTVFVDGMLEGLWRVEDGRPVVVDLFRPLSASERSDLDDELDRVAALLSR